MLTLFVDWLTEGSTGLQVARHSLSYIQEIGNGWFGQVRFVSFLMYKFATFPNNFSHLKASCLVVSVFLCSCWEIMDLFYHLACFSVSRQVLKVCMH